MTGAYSEVSFSNISMIHNDLSRYLENDEQFFYLVENVENVASLYVEKGMTTFNYFNNEEQYIDLWEFLRRVDLNQETIDTVTKYYNYFLDTIIEYVKIIAIASAHSHLDYCFDDQQRQRYNELFNLVRGVLQESDGNITDFATEYVSAENEAKIYKVFNINGESKYEILYAYNSKKDKFFFYKYLDTIYRERFESYAQELLKMYVYSIDSFEHYRKIRIESIINNNHFLKHIVYE